MDPIYEVYRKNFITMDKLSEDEIKNIFADLNKIEDDEARDILKILIYGREGLDGDRPEEENKNQDLEEVKDNKEEVLKNFEVSDAIKIENSDYGILEVDRAGARSRWFLVKISDDKMEFLSELEETSPKASGRMDKDGVIHLEFNDINNNKTTYISKDKGRTFEKIKSQ